jgi:hypothetical protein
METSIFGVVNGLRMMYELIQVPLRSIDINTVRAMLPIKRLLFQNITRRAKATSETCLTQQVAGRSVT